MLLQAELMNAYAQRHQERRRHTAGPKKAGTKTAELNKRKAADDNRQIQDAAAKLPPSVKPHNRVGMVAKMTGFSVSKVRTALKK